MINKTKRILIIMLVFTLLIVTAGVAAAKSTGNPKGEIISIDETEGMLTLLTENGEIFVTLPEEFDYDSIEIGMFVLVKGTWLSETEIAADWVKPIEEDDLDDEPKEPD